MRSVRTLRALSRRLHQRSWDERGTLMQTPEQGEEPVNLPHVCFLHHKPAYSWHLNQELRCFIFTWALNFIKVAGVVTSFLKREHLGESCAMVPHSGGSCLVSICVNYNQVHYPVRWKHTFCECFRLKENLCARVVFFIVKSKRQHTMNTTCKLKITTFPHSGNKNMANCSYAIIWRLGYCTVHL